MRESINVRGRVVPVAVVVMALLAIGTAFAAVALATIQGTVTINEALSVSTTDYAVSGFSGETIDKTVTINNAASVPLNALLTTTEIDNPDGVIYTISYSSNPASVPAIGTTDVIVSFHIAPDSPNGVFHVSTQIDRTA